MRSTFKVLFYVKKGSEKPNGNLPLMCRLTVDGEIKQFSCKMDIPLRLWDVKTGRASGQWTWTMKNSNSPKGWALLMSSTPKQRMCTNACWT